MENLILKILLKQWKMVLSVILVWIVIFINIPNIVNANETVSTDEKCFLTIKIDNNNIKIKNI